MKNAITRGASIGIVVVIILVAAIGGYAAFVLTGNSTSNTTTSSLTTSSTFSSSSTLSYGSTSSSSSAKSINIGVFAAMSGADASADGQVLPAVQIGAAQVNANGGVDIAGTNYTLNIVGVDITSDASQAPTLAGAALSKTDFVAGIGSDISGMSLAIEPILEQYKVPWVEGGISNSLSAINSTGNGPVYHYFFSNSPNVTVVGGFTVQYIKYLNAISPVQRIAIVYENSEYGVGTANATYADLAAAGFTPVLYKSYPTPLTAADASSVATAIKNSNAQIILPISNSISDGELLMQNIRAQGVNAPIFGAGPAFGPDLIPAIGSSANYVMDNDGWFPDLAPSFAQAFLSKTGTPAEVAGGTAYIQFWILVKALQDATAPTSAAVEQALLNVNITSGPAFQMYGNIYFSPHSHRDPIAPLFVAENINGTYHTVYPPQFATATVVWPPPS